jgi:hypothetical protein
MPPKKRSGVTGSADDHDAVAEALARASSALDANLASETPTSEKEAKEKEKKKKKKREEKGSFGLGVWRIEEYSSLKEYRKIQESPRTFTGILFRGNFIETV